MTESSDWRFLTVYVSLYEQGMVDELSVSFRRQVCTLESTRKSFSEFFHSSGLDIHQDPGAKHVDHAFRLTTSHLSQAEKVPFSL